MGLIATRDKRDRLRLLFEDSQTTAQPLKTVLMAAMRLCDAAIANGTWLSSTGEGGGSVAFSVLSSQTPQDARRLCGELLDLYDVVVAWFQAGTPSAYGSTTAVYSPSNPLTGDTKADDLVIFNQMLGVSKPAQSLASGPTGPRLVRVG